MNCAVSRVSIITVSYNSVKTIELTMQSVLHQSYQDIEYIVIDGASTDGTQKVIEKYADKISYYVSERDDGLYYAMNKGIEKATGDIIGIINSDDWYAETAVEDVVKCFNQSNPEAVYGLTVMVSEDGAERIGKIKQVENFWYQMPFQHPSVFIKKDVYKRLGGFNTNYRVASDYDFLLKCYSENVRFAYCDKVIAYFRRGGISDIHREVGCKEDYRISMSYIDKCPYKELILPRIKESYDWSCFDIALNKKKGMLSKLLYEYFKETIMSVSIWGTGVWGEKCYKILKGEGVEISNFVDNDAAKENMELYGVKIISPKQLHDMNQYVLIAVKECGEEIRSQLEDISNKLKCVSIEELRKNGSWRKSI